VINNERTIIIDGKKRFMGCVVEAETEEGARQYTDNYLYQLRYNKYCEN